MKLVFFVRAAVSGVVMMSSGFGAWAMPAPLHVKPGAISTPLKSSGIANGGHAQDEFSLLGLNDVVIGADERLVLNYGDRFGQVWKGEPGFFQVALDSGGKRLVIDLSQVTRTGIDPTQLRTILAKSKFVASSDMTMDPQDQTTNLTLTLKSPVEVRLMTVNSGRSQVILDLKGQ